MKTSPKAGPAQGGHPGRRYALAGRLSRALKPSGAEARYRRLFETMIEGFCIIEVLFDGDDHPVDYRFLETNPAFEAQTGLKHAKGRRMRELAPGHEAHWFEIYGRVALTGEAVRFVNEAKALGRWFEVSAYRVGAPDSRKVGILFADITEARRAEEERRRLEERTLQAQKLEALGVLVAGVAHNFNNILTIIMGTASVQEQLVTDPSELEALRIICTASQRGRGLVQSLTHFSRPSMMQREAIELTGLVTEVLTLLEHTTRNRIDIRAAFAGEPLWILGDRGTLSSVLMNVCLNSLDAMPEGGTLTLGTARVEPDRLEISVVDTGAGMSPEILARVAEPFFTTKPVGKGTGLGLSITHGVIKAHGGTMDITSAPHRGTQVRLRLPQLLEPGQESASQAAPPVLGLARILLVDDDLDVRILMTRMLKRAGALQVDSAAGGREALERLGSGEVPDLVILDQNMPGMDGLQTLARIRDLHPDLPILVSSGQHDIQDWGAFKQKNVAIISKPFTLEEIQDKLAGMGAESRRD